MTAEFGLPLPERRVGLSAHDFVQGLSSPTVMLTRAERIEEHQQFLAAGCDASIICWLDSGRTSGLGRPTPWLDWVDALDRPTATVNAAAPRPTPPVKARPHNFLSPRLKFSLETPTRSMRGISWHSGR